MYLTLYNILKSTFTGETMKDVKKQNYIPVYTLQKLNDQPDYSLLIDNDYRFFFKKGNLTNIVWHVTQEYHSHNFWEICLVIKGNSLQRFPDRAPKPMEPGSVYLLRPHDAHCISPDQIKKPSSMETSNYIHRDIYIPTEKMKQVCGALREDLYDELLNANEPLNAAISHSETKHLESLLNSYTGKDEDFSFMHTVVVSHILCMLLERRQYNKAEYPEWINTLLANMNREEFMTKDIQEIIRSIGYNQSYVCRQFKKFTSQTLTDYIHFRKCSYSTSLLSNFDIPISKISYRLNFSDQSAYTRIFKSFYRITPGQWRKRLLETSKSNQTSECTQDN